MMGTRSMEARRAGMPAKGPALSSAEMAQFFEMWGAMTSAGIPAARALDGLREQPGWERPLEATVRALEAGYSVSRSFARGGFRDPMVIGLLRLAEETGTLDQAIAELAQLFRWRSELSGELKSMMIYPTILTISCALLVGLGPPFLMRPILDFLASSGQALPWATVLLMAMVGVMSSPWFWLGATLLVGALVWGGGTFARRSPERYESYLLRLPGIGDCWAQVVSVRFGKALLSGLGSGCSMLNSLEMAAACCGSTTVGAQGQEAKARLLAGEPLEKVFEPFSGLDRLLVRSIPLALESGAVESMLGAVLRLTQERLRHHIDRALALLEPLLIGFMGGLVALCVLATVAPMMTLLGGLG